MLTAKTLTSVANVYAQISKAISLKQSIVQMKGRLQFQATPFYLFTYSNKTIVPYAPSFPFRKLVRVRPSVRQDIFPFRVALISYKYP